MIHKSYIVEEKINVLMNKIILIYGENLGLINSLKDKFYKIKNTSNNTHLNFPKELLKKLLWSQDYQVLRMVLGLLRQTLHQQQQIWYKSQVVNQKLYSLCRTEKQKSCTLKKKDK